MGKNEISCKNLSELRLASDEEKPQNRFVTYIYLILRNRINWGDQLII